MFIVLHGNSLSPHIKAPNSTPQTFSLALHLATRGWEKFSANFDFVRGYGSVVNNVSGRYKNLGTTIEVFFLRSIRMEASIDHFYKDCSPGNALLGFHAVWGMLLVTSGFDGLNIGRVSSSKWLPQMECF